MTAYNIALIVKAFEQSAESEPDVPLLGKNVEVGPIDLAPIVLRPVRPRGSFES